MNFEDLKTSLKGFKPEEIVFTGLGNEYRGDDSAGLVFLHKLEQAVYFADSHFILAGNCPENYLDLILSYNPSLVVFIDAVQYSKKINSIGWLESGEIDSLEISTHAFSMDLIKKYLQSCKQVEIKFLGIAICAASFGRGISEEISRSIDSFFEVPVENVHINFKDII